MLLVHCKIQQTTFKRIACMAQRKHLEPTELERVKETRKKQTQAIAAIAATVFHWTIELLLLTERLLWSCCGCRWFPLPMKQEQPHFQILLTTGVFTINCLACVRENFLVTRQGYAAQCWSQMDTKASITETVQAKPPEKAEICPRHSNLDCESSVPDPVLRLNLGKLCHAQQIDF